MRNRLAIARLSLLVVALTACGVTLAIVGTDGLRDLLTEAGESNWGLVAFVVLYALLVMVLMPGTIATLTAGAVFGFPLGAFAALAGATIGATGGFIISRALGREGAHSLFGARLTNIDDFIGRNDFTSVLVLRLMPIVPFNAMNYAAGLTSVRLSRYVAATAIGIAPGAFLTTGIGDQADDPTSAPFLILVALFVVVLVASGLYARRIETGRADV